MKLSMYTEFKHYASWKNCSLDSSSDESMVDNEKEIINFDLVKKFHLNLLGKSEECSASVDVLCEDKNEHIFMIEFKNGSINTDEIRKKLVESLILFTDITNQTINYTRENMDFVLVYNPEKIKFNSTEQRAIHLAILGRSTCSLYKLDNYAGFLVQKSFLMPVDQFINKMVNNLLII